MAFMRTGLELLAWRARQSLLWPWAAGFLLVLSLSLPARVLDAEPAPSPKPKPTANEGSKAKLLELSADRVDIDVEAKSAVLEGHVKLARAGISMGCARAEARFGDGFSLVWAKGTGGVSAEVKGVNVQAPQVEVDFAKQTMSFSGGVKLTKGEGWLSAQRATVRLDTGKVSMSEVEGALLLGQ